jgi:hypothetical protein
MPNQGMIPKSGYRFSDKIMPNRAFPKRAPHNRIKL